MPKIVNLGSLCIDHVYEVPTLVRAGETMASASHQIFAGGKGLNQSLAAALAGARVHHAGAVGADGAFLVQQLKQAGVNTQLVQQTAGSSGHAVIQVDPQGQNAIVIAGGSNRELPSSLFEQVISELGSEDWLLLQNEINDLPKILALAKAAGVRVAFNLAPVDGREQGYDLDQVALLIVNEIEIQALAPSDGSPEAALGLLAARMPMTDILLTLGGDGLIYAAAGSAERLRLAAHPVQAVDETAAGDAFIGYLLAGLSAGLSMLEALQRASAAGALAVMQAGAAPSLPKAAQVDAFLAEKPLLEPKTSV